MRRLSEGAVLVVLFCLAGPNCADPMSPPTAKVAARATTVVFDSGRGAGQYDEMTYAKYESEIAFTPQTDVTVRGIRPQIYYCNGSSGFLAFIRSAQFEPLAAEAGLVDGTGPLVPTFADRHLDSQVTLKAGTTYLIIMEVWTTKSVGIYTTGDRSAGSIGAADYVTKYARSDTADHLDRGGIAFQLTE